MQYSLSPNFGHFRIEPLVRFAPLLLCVIPCVITLPSLSVSGRVWRCYLVTQKGSERPGNPYEHCLFCITPHRCLSARIYSPVEMAWKRSSVRSRPGPPSPPGTSKHLLPRLSRFLVANSRTMPRTGSHLLTSSPEAIRRCGNPFPVPTYGSNDCMQDPLVVTVVACRIMR